MDNMQASVLAGDCFSISFGIQALKSKMVGQPFPVAYRHSLGIQTCLVQLFLFVLIHQK